MKHQSEDGAWRSDVYATFKDGTALTPLVVCALQDAGRAEDVVARRKASVWLARLVKADGTIDEGKDGLPYPVYTSALSVLALSHEENKDFVKQRDAWLKHLLDRQLTEANGWHPDDKQYGGWGYYPGIPKKPAPGQEVPSQHLLETNLSATAFAIDALRVVDVRPAGLEYLLAQLLGQRLMNPDGGFRFIHDDPVRNKAGSVVTADGKPQFHSYGSATADGARVMHHLTYFTNKHSRRPAPEPGKPLPPPGFSLPLDGGKSFQWLEDHFEADRHPGTYIPTHERNRNAVYFYYARSAAKTFAMVGRTGQLRELSDALVAKQQADGSWVNAADQQRENDSLLATAYAVSALGECRKALAK